MNTALDKTTYDTLTTHLPERGSREWYLAKRARKLGRHKGGGRAVKFREIRRFKPITLEQIIAGAIPKVFESEYYFYLWNAGPLLCVYCGDKLTKFNKTQDHVIPRADGGSQLGRDNLMPCCRGCNWEKADTKLLLFLLERKQGM